METLDRYLANLASAQPVPGGGSAAAIVAACGAALVGMVARICERNPKYAGYADLTERIADASDRLRQRLETARERDERAFARVVAAQGLPKETAAEKAARANALESALRDAAEAPLAAAALALDVVRFAAQLLVVPNKHLASDVGCAAEFGSAALTACAYNVRVNHRYMRDEATIADQAAALVRYESEGSELLTRVRRHVREALAGKTP
ncbi:MAG: cyclodeaminase/cyclohydrolase family protein [Candidatus Tumulicola sp.]